jgi:hypothetical protein
MVEGDAEKKRMLLADYEARLERERMEGDAICALAKGVTSYLTALAFGRRRLTGCAPSTPSPSCIRA